MWLWANCWDALLNILILKGHNQSNTDYFTRLLPTIFRKRKKNSRWHRKKGEQSRGALRPGTISGPKPWRPGPLRRAEEWWWRSGRRREPCGLRYPRCLSPWLSSVCFWTPSYLDSVSRESHSLHLWVTLEFIISVFLCVKGRGAEEKRQTQKLRAKRETHARSKIVKQETELWWNWKTHSDMKGLWPWCKRACQQITR